VQAVNVSLWWLKYRRIRYLSHHREKPPQAKINRSPTTLVSDQARKKEKKPPQCFSRPRLPTFLKKIWRISKVSSRLCPNK